MARLPQPGGDSGNWGDILNDYLSQAHTATGAIKPGAVSKSDVGLGNVNNTADADKPISSATQTALDGKLSNSSNLSDLANASTARTNLGLGDSATRNVSQIATDPSIATAIRTGAPQPTFYHDFRNKANHTIANGELSDSGHAFQVRGQRPFIVQDGVLTMTHTQPVGTEAAYLLTQLDADVGMIRAWVKVLESGDPTTSPIASATMVISQEAFDINTSFSDAATHCSWNHATTASGSPVTDTASMRYDTFTKAGSATPRFRGQFPFLVPDVEYKIEVNLRDKYATVTLPNGEVIESDVNDLFLTKRGPHACWEIYVPSGGAAHRRIGFTRIEAETIDRVNNSRGATNSDLGGIREQPGRLLGFAHTTGSSTATALTTSLSTALHSVRIPIPRSHKILIEGWSWFDVSVPVTPNTLSQLLIGCYVDGNSAYGRLTTVYSGRTPANNTADAAAFADRQGTMVAYGNGMLIPWALTLDIDPAFQHGDLRNITVRAQASASGLFTFIDSGVGGGSGSTIRRSSLKVTAL